MKKQAEGDFFIQQKPDREAGPQTAAGCGTGRIGKKRGILLDFLDF